MNAATGVFLHDPKQAKEGSCGTRQNVATTVDATDLQGRKPRKKGDIVFTKLSKEDNEEMEAAIKETIYKYGMQPARMPGENMVTDQLRGSHDGTDKSLPQYNKYWGELGRFAFLIGDYITATICHDDLRPADPLPANPNTIGLFYHYKSFTRLNRVKDLSNHHVQYTNGPHKGQFIVGSCSMVANGDRKKGGWSDPSNIRKCRVALRTLHRAFCAGEFPNAYYAACSKCIKRNEALAGKINWRNTEQRRFECCDTCTFHKVKARGDPTYELKCAARFQRVHNMLKDKHRARGALHMTTHQVRVIREHIMSCGSDLKYLQLWTMILMGIQLFLRAEEVTSICLEQFRMESWKVYEKEAHVDQIVLWVKGKCDVEEQSLAIYRDDENPEFCLVRTLLVYIAAAKLKGPFLFPASAEPMDGHVQYDKLLSEIKVRHV